MKILSAAQIREADQYTIEHEPIASIDLMERASGVFANWFGKLFEDEGTTVYIFCGIGNNGGDGLAVARMLEEDGYTVEVYVARYSENCSADFLTNEKRLEELGVAINDIQEGDSFPALAPYSIVIDALWGSGLTRPVEGYWASLLNHLNEAEVIRVALDVPSGLFADMPSSGATFHADFTLTFELPKLAFLMAENETAVGEWDFSSIGLSQEFIIKQTTPYHIIDAYTVSNIYRPRMRHSHKGSYGHALMISGSYGKMGAAVLATQACLRSGSGLVSIHLPRCGYTIVQSTTPEAMVHIDMHDEIITGVEHPENFTTIGIGPGLGTHAETAQALLKVIEQFQRPMVLDADALNILSQHKDWLEQLPQNSILTPHPKEFERLFGSTGNSFERIALAQQKAQALGVYIVLKGAHTAINTPEGTTWFNPTGNPGMATGGSGDVLTGILTGLLAQGYTPHEACILGVYLHGHAGDLAAKQNSEEAMIAGDIVQHIGKAYQQISR